MFLRFRISLRFGCGLLLGFCFRFRLGFRLLSRTRGALFLRLFLLSLLLFHLGQDLLQLGLDRFGVVRVVVEVAGLLVVADHTHRLVEDHDIDVIVLLEQ